MFRFIYSLNCVFVVVFVLWMLWYFLSFSRQIEFNIVTFLHWLLDVRFGLNDFEMRFRTSICQQRTKSKQINVTENSIEVFQIGKDSYCIFSFSIPKYILFFLLLFYFIVGMVYRWFVYICGESVIVYSCITSQNSWVNSMPLQKFLLFFFVVDKNTHKRKWKTTTKFIKIRENGTWKRAKYA